MLQMAPGFILHGCHNSCVCDGITGAKLIIMSSYLQGKNDLIAKIDRKMPKTFEKHCEVCSLCSKRTFIYVKRTEAKCCTEQL